MLCNRATMVLLVGTISLSFIFKTHLEELRELSYVFLSAVGLFITLFFVELMRDKTPAYESWERMSVMKADY